MQYNGQELKLITEPKIFDPPKEMLVWDNGSHEPHIELVWGIAPASANSEFPIHCVGDVYYQNCAEIPEEPKPKRATYRQLMEWLVKGNGLWNINDDNWVRIRSKLWLEEKINDDGILIRPFGTTEWLEPTLENMGMEE